MSPPLPITRRGRGEAPGIYATPHSGVSPSQGEASRAAPRPHEFIDEGGGNTYSPD
ncbi:MAG: hypothetical protein Q4C87_00340 [Actinomycetaceae bacterium]|nr:hypothetical protein [Actinomycetaceae bacterium]